MKNLRGEAILCSAYELNRSPSESLPAGKTPALLWHGRQDLSKLRIFGCRAWCITLPKESKLEPRAKRGVMVGYCGSGYRVWLPQEEKVVKSRDVRFDESVAEYRDHLNQENHTPSDN